MCRYFKRIAGVGSGDYIYYWKSEGLSDENITAPSATNKFPSLEYFGTKPRVRFSGSCLKQNAITYNHEKSVNIYIVYEINKNDNTTSTDPTLERCLFGELLWLKIFWVWYWIWQNRKFFISWHWIRQKCNNFWSRHDFINKDW